MFSKWSKRKITRSREESRNPAVGESIYSTAFFRDLTEASLANRSGIEGYITDTNEVLNVGVQSRTPRFQLGLRAKSSCQIQLRFREADWRDRIA